MKIDFLAIILILLVYDYGNTSSQTCLLKYQFWALENVTRGMSGPTVAAPHQRAFLQWACSSQLPQLLFYLPQIAHVGSILGT